MLLFRDKTRTYSKKLIYQDTLAYEGICQRIDLMGKPMDILRVSDS
jgi:hypothetical protein